MGRGRGEMLKKPHYIILVLVVLLVMVLLKLPGETMGKVKLAISGLFLPLFGLTGSVHELTGEAREAWRPKGQLARQNEELRRQNEELKIRLQQDAAIWSENARLRGLVGWPRQTLLERQAGAGSLPAIRPIGGAACKSILARAMASSRIIPF